jgi:DNA replication protein DnaC
VGKTHLAVALGVKAVEAGHSVLFQSLETLLTRLIRARQENRVDRRRGWRRRCGPPSPADDR